MQIAVPLVNEAQLGSRLNAAIEHNRRGEFALLLALLSVDARDMAQFQGQQQDQTEQKLRHQFDLPPAASLLADLSLDDAIVDNSPLFLQASPRAFQLQQAIKPEALVIRGREPQGMVEVLSNCDLTTQQRQRKQLASADIQAALLKQLPHFADQLAMQRNLAPLLASA
ncbi:VC2046/SO_2500 family protein [Shewanella sp.]|uniref:VC2046/SO_2500 family protein n=1 Tax=Shewanella sp. TaxID=50422 RepID=UPI003F2C3E05